MNRPSGKIFKLGVPSECIKYIMEMMIEQFWKKRASSAIKRYISVLCGEKKYRSDKVF